MKCYFSSGFKIFKNLWNYCTNLTYISQIWCDLILSRYMYQCRLQLIHKLGRSIRNIYTKYIFLWNMEQVWWVSVIESDKTDTALICLKSLHRNSSKMHSQILLLKTEREKVLVYFLWQRVPLVKFSFNFKACVCYFLSNFYFFTKL